MKTTALHHVSIVSSNIRRSVAFYVDVLGFTEVPRPAFTSSGAWLMAGPAELHLISNPDGTLRRTAAIDTEDIHFALRVEDFESAVRWIAAKGYPEGADKAKPRELYVNRNSKAGYKQAYILDPDRNLIEINAV